MVRYQYPSKVKRGVCFIIDASIVFGLGFLMAFLILRFSGFNEYLNKAYELGYVKIFEDPRSKEAIDCILAILYNALITSGCFFVVIFIYLIILPYFISWQTLGRLITKTRLLARKTNERPSFLKLVLREIVGEFLIYVLLSIILRFMNIVFYISVGYYFLQDISIPDLISKTRIVNKDPVIEEEFAFKGEDYKYSENYDWEADSNLEGDKKDENATSEE